MDIATLIGLISGLAIIITAILLGGDLGQFINVPSILIVFGGTAAATFIKFQLKDVGAALKIGMKSAFKVENHDPTYLIDLSVELATLVRKGGLIALENTKIDNELFAKGIRLCVDGHSLEVVKDTVSKEIALTINRLDEGDKILRGMGDSAPAFGMIGTLVGLVQMLSNMDDPKTIGPAMAVAMLTTFYGAVIANLITIPMADKLVNKKEQEQRSKDLILESIVQIHGSQNPTVLKEMLSVYLVAEGKSSNTSDD